VDTTTSNIGPQLKEKVASKIEDAVEKATETWNLIEKGKTESTNALGYRLPSSVEDNASELWSSVEGDDFPEGDTDVPVSMNVKYTRVYKTGTITGDVRNHEKDPDKIGSIISSKFGRAVMDLKKSINRMLFGESSGELARISAINTGTRTITCATTVNQFGVRKVKKRHKLEVRSAGGALRSTNTDYLVVESIDRDNDNFVYKAAPGLAGDAAINDLLTLKKSYGNALHGLDYHLGNSGVYQNVTRGATNPALNAMVIDAQTEYLSASMIDKLINGMTFKAGEENSDDLIITWSPAQKQQYWNLGYRLQQIAGGAKKFDLSFEGATHQGIPTRVDVDCPNNSLYCWRPSKLKRYQLEPIGMIDIGFGLLSPKNAASGQGHADAYNFYIGGKFEIGCQTPHLLGGRISNLNTVGLPDGRDA
jgi:hypothetical protein